jgi:hypothetical protein
MAVDRVTQMLGPPATKPVTIVTRHALKLALHVIVWTANLPHHPYLLIRCCSNCSPSSQRRLCMRQCSHLGVGIAINVCRGRAGSCSC